MSSNDELDVPESEIKVEFVRSSGPGGQNVNTNDTAAKLLHIPTGASSGNLLFLHANLKQMINFYNDLFRHFL